MVLWQILSRTRTGQSTYAVPRASIRFRPAVHRSRTFSAGGRVCVAITSLCFPLCARGNYLVVSRAAAGTAWVFRGHGAGHVDQGRLSSTCARHAAVAVRQRWTSLQARSSDGFGCLERWPRLGVQVHRRSHELRHPSLVPGAAESWVDGTSLYISYTSMPAVALLLVTQSVSSLVGDAEQTGE